MNEKQITNGNTVLVMVLFVFAKLRSAQFSTPLPGDRAVAVNFRVGSCPNSKSTFHLCYINCKQYAYKKQASTTHNFFYLIATDHAVSDTYIYDTVIKYY